MNIKQVIKDEIITRAAAARDLRDGLKINDIDILAGCDREGIQIYSGIEQVAEIVGETITTDVIEDGKWEITTKSFVYGVGDENDVKFYQRDYKAIKPVKVTIKGDF